MTLRLYYNLKLTAFVKTSRPLSGTTERKLNYDNPNKIFVYIAFPQNTDFLNML